MVSLDSDPYLHLVGQKIKIDNQRGIDVDLASVNPRLKPFNRKMVQWALKGGRRALFASFGLHKTVCQIEIMRQVGIHRPGGLRLIVLPLGVRQEFYSDAEQYFEGDCAVNLEFIRSQSEIVDRFAGDSGRIYLTNYESVRDGKFDLSLFEAVSLDEADCLRSFGSKTFSEMLFGAAQAVPLRFVNTATPSPNDYQELLAYAHFLGVMEIGEARTRFFQRNSEKADDLTLYPHMEDQFWLWVSSWSLWIDRPSLLGDSDKGYNFPNLDLRIHEVPSNHIEDVPKADKIGRQRLFREEAVGVTAASREKRSSMEARVAKLLHLRAENVEAHRLIWHDLEDERRAIEAAIPTVVSVYGSQDDAEQERAILGFRSGEIQELAAKPVMLGGGCNFQRHCNWAIFLGIGFKFRDFIQAIHRLQRFGQTKAVRVDLIHSELERPVLAELMRKWDQHRAAVKRMTEIVERHGLNNRHMSEALEQTIEVHRAEAVGERFLLAKNDAVMEARLLESDSLGLVVTSWPFGNQYRYTTSYLDFGQNVGLPAFFRQMSHLTTEIYRALMPGRLYCVHVKDRVVPGEMIGQSYQTIEPFHARSILHLEEHGFHFMGMVTVVTDVVRENNATYRLGYTEMRKDGTRMGFGLPEYVLVFRKPPTDPSRGYADCPVVKSEEEYPLSRWQIDAHGFWRSSGDRLLQPDELVGERWQDIIARYRNHSLTSVYDFEHELRLAEAVDQGGGLPRDFMLMQPQSWSPHVWSDVFRAGTLNAFQSLRGREKHLCPLQYDIVDRLIERYSMEGETVYDPFSGLGTVPVRAIKFGRFGRGSELNGQYWGDSVSYARRAEAGLPNPTLFDALESSAEVPA